MESITSFERRQGAKLIITDTDAERNDQSSQELEQQQAEGGGTSSMTSE